MRLQYSDEVLIKGLQQRKLHYISYIYREFTPIVRHLVQQKSGNESDVDDLVQEAMIILYKRSLNEPFKLECSLKTFFISICKNLWLQRLDNRYRLLYQSELEVNEPSQSYALNEMEIREEDSVKRRLFYKNMLALPADCQRILELYFLKVPFREIARLMGLRDEFYVKTRKYACKNLLRKKIMNDPEYHQYFEYERH